MLRVRVTSPSDASFGNVGDTKPIRTVPLSAVMVIGVSIVNCSFDAITAGSPTISMSPSSKVEQASVLSTRTLAGVNQKSGITIPVSL